mmetsp:Transcript_4262/g.14084  ORF Transcript_4262/g.14084 Transcript_4262/m.14084 type:complete len:573 (-) Transcript_4262:433-2151(-)
MLSFEEQAALLKVHAIQLLTVHPEPATELLMRLCVAAAKARRELKRMPLEDKCKQTGSCSVHKSGHFATFVQSSHRNCGRTSNTKARGSVCLYDVEGDLHEDFLSSLDYDGRKKPDSIYAEDEDSRLSPVPILTDIVPNGFIHHFIHQPSYLRVFLEYVRREACPLPVDCAKNVVNTLIEIVLNEWMSAKETLEDLRAKVKQQEPLLAKIDDIPVVVTWSDGTADGGDEDAPATESSTSAALMPETAVRLKEASRRVRQKADDALALLAEKPAVYDKYFAVVLVESRDFAPGRLYLYEHSMRRNDAHPYENSDAMAESMVNDILLEEYAKLHDVKAMLRICRAQGRANPALWFSLIHYVKDAVPHQSRHDFIDKCDDLADVLGVVDDEKAIPVQRCVQLCSESQDVPVDALKPYFNKLLINGHAAVLQNRAAIFDLRQQTSAMRYELQDLRSAAVRLLPNQAASDKIIKRATVGRPGTAWAAFLLVLLEFSDYDTFSQHLDNTDFNEEDHPAAAVASVNDPSLGGEHRKWEQIKRSQRATADDHEQFFKELEDPESGGFECVVRYFGKGVIQ